MSDRNGSIKALVDKAFWDKNIREVLLGRMKDLMEKRNKLKIQEKGEKDIIKENMKMMDLFAYNENMKRQI
jgi:hypothetical protein